MARMVEAELVVTGTTQFGGTEFNVRPRPQSMLKLVEVNIRGGIEPKTWEVRKTSTKSATLPLVLLESLTESGVPGQTTEKAFRITGDDIATLCAPGEQIQVMTTGKTSDMRVKFYFLDLEPSELV
jgi:hypothetical protein